MNDLDILKKLEKILKIKLTKLDTLASNVLGYTLDSCGELIGLSLFSCAFDNTKLELIISALKELKSLTVLDLSSNQISNISPLKELESLMILNLSNNRISNISPLKELESLTTLNLSINQISDISPLKELKSLADIGLSDNRISDISPLKELKSLTSLFLWANQICDISPLKELESLTELELSENQISDISPLKELKSLTELELFENQINDISPLKELKSLEQLDLSINQISNISALKELKSLTELELFENQISDISPLKELESLFKLHLSNNQISDISPLKELKSLWQLHLSDNKISDISPLRKLKRIHILDLRNNPIEKLPAWITEFKMDIRWEQFSPSDGIIFYNNPIKSPPIEIVKQGEEALKVYFESIDVEEVLYETKLVIVGRGFAGKTVLAKKLLDITFRLPKKQDTTKGIVVIKEPLFCDIKEYGVKFKYHLWDFGGQEKYDATHQFFITENSLYLFVTEVRQENNYLDFDFWLNTIELFANDAPVIVVMSKIDERKKDLPQTTFKDRYKNIFDFEKVSCADGREDTISNLKNIIVEATTQRLKLIKFPSRTWRNVPDSLEKTAKWKDYISYSEYLEICDGFGLDEMKANVLSKYLHDLGLIIHRRDDLLLSNTIIINIDWCVDGAYKVLDNPKVLEQKGYFSEDDLKEIWQDEKYHNKQQELLNLMKKYKLCFELRDKTGYIAPSLLTEDKPKGLSWDYSGNLFFEYCYTFMPAGLLCRFIVESHAFIKGTSYWKYGVEIEYEETTALIVEDYIGRKITIAIKGGNKKGLLNTIRMFFAEVHKDIKALVPIEMIPCNCTECNHSTTPYFHKYSDLNKFLSKGNITIPCMQTTEAVVIQTLIDDILPEPSQLIISDEDLQEFIYGLLPDIQDKITWREGYSYLWSDKECNKTPKNETEIHPLMSILLDAGCKLKGIQLTREEKISNGNVDISFSYTTREDKIARTCIEIKKAEHPDIETAIGTQLTAYLNGMKSKHGIYLVLWFKNKEYNYPKYSNMKELENAIMLNVSKGYSIKVKIINCNKPISPSRL